MVPVTPGDLGILALARRHATISTIVLLVLLPFLVKAPILSGLLVSDTATRYAAIEVERHRGITAGGPTIDPNIGYTSHALGTYAAREIMSGRLPWWNPYEGVGVPLAAEMQSAALFPLTPLLLLPQGQALFHIVLQIIAGLATFGLLRELGLRNGPALSGAVAFEFNAVFAWMANAVVNPVAFLPVILWGIERQRHDDGRSGFVGTVLIATGFAAALYAGFPEVAYLNGLFAGAWAALRFAQSRSRWRLAWSIAAPAIAGVLLAAPVVMPFLDYLGDAELGMHSNTAGHFTHLEPAYMLLTLFPYYLGGIFSAPIEGAFWGNVGGYAGTLPAVFAIAGTLGKRDIGLRRMMAAWVIVTLALTFGASWVFAVVELLPGVREAALYRYLPASWLMAMSVLAAMAIDDLRRDGAMRPLVLGFAVVSAVALAMLVVGHRTIGWTPRGAYAWITVVFQLGLFGLTVLIIAARRWVDGRLGVIVSTIMIAEGLMLFALPVLAHPRHMVTDTRGIAFLQRNLGLQRFATLGPIAPNYGSYFGIAQVNHNDLPIPRAWAAFVRRHLDARAHPILFTRISSADEAMRNRDAYATIGTRYLVVPRGTILPGLTAVHSDRLTTIFELPGVRPYFSAPACTVAVISRTSLTAACARPSVLTRLELAMPGWTARINGRASDLRKVGGIFQGIALPAGRSAIAFDYAPPSLRYAVWGAMCGLLLLGILLTEGLRRRTVRSVGW